ncbi:MAG: hypothetical protein ACOYLB_15235 [Phototrophicaceae bacterium]
MCMFCATIPLVASFGSMATANRKRYNRLGNSALDLSWGQRWLLSVPTVSATTALVVLLLLSSAYYHSRIQPL